MLATVIFWDVRPQTRVAYAPDMFQVMLFMPSSAWIHVLRASVVDVVLVRVCLKTINTIICIGWC